MITVPQPQWQLNLSVRALVWRVFVSVSLEWRIRFRKRDSEILIQSLLIGMMVTRPVPDSWADAAAVSLSPVF